MWRLNKSSKINNSGILILLAEGTMPMCVLKMGTTAVGLDIDLWTEQIKMKNSQLIACGYLRAQRKGLHSSPSHRRTAQTWHKGNHFWLSLSGEYPEPNAVFGAAASSVSSILAGAGDLVRNGPIRDEDLYGWPITAQYSPCTGWPPGTASWAAQRSQPDPRVSALPPAANTQLFLVQFKL